MRLINISFFLFPLIVVFFIFVFAGFVSAGCCCCYIPSPFGDNGEQCSSYTCGDEGACPEQCGGGGDDSNCPYGNLRGNVEVANCTEIKGWAHDGGTEGSPVRVYLYENGNHFATVDSSYLRQDICDFFSFQADCVCDNAGWTLTTPNSLKDGNTHTITAWAEADNPGFGWTQLEGSPSLTCSPPVAACSCPTTTANVNDVISFNNSSTNAGSYTWYFGDGATSTVAEPTHSYSFGAAFPVRLTAWGSGGTAGLSSSVKCCDVSVTSPQTIMTCSVSGNQITWNWDVVPNASIYGFRRTGFSEIETSQTSITRTVDSGTHTGYVKVLSPFTTNVLAAATCEIVSDLNIFKREIDDPNASCAEVMADVSPTESSSSPLLAAVLGVKTAMSNLLAQEEPVEGPITDPITEDPTEEPVESPEPGDDPVEPVIEEPIEEPVEPIVEEGGTFRAKIIEDITHGLLTGSILNLDASVEVEPGNYEIKGDYNSNDDLFSRDNYVICDDDGNRSAGSDSLTVTVDPGVDTNVYIGFVERLPGTIELIKKEVDETTTTCTELEGKDPPSPGTFKAKVGLTDYTINTPKTTISNLTPAIYTVTALIPENDNGKYMDDSFIYCVDGYAYGGVPEIGVMSNEITTVYVGFVKRSQVTGNIYLRDDQACLASGEPFSDVTINCTAFSDFRQAVIDNGVYTCQNPSDNSLYFNPDDQVGVTMTGIPTEYKYSCMVGDSVITVPEDGPNFVLTSVQDAWFQTQGGDIYAGSQIQSDIPATCIEELDCFPILSLDSTASNQPGSVSWGGGNDPELGSGSVSSIGWQAETGSYGGLRADYAFFRKHLGSHFDDMDSADYPGDGFWLTDIAEDTLTIGDGWNIPDNDQVVVVHNGDINVEANIEISGTTNASLLMVASGTITFTGEVTSAMGAYIADQIVVEDDGDTNQQFIGQGSFIGWGSIFLNRDLDIDNNTNPGELFIYKPEFIYYLPDLVKRPLYDWHEVGY